MSKSFQNAVNWALMVALVLGGGALARADEEANNGKVVRIGHSDGDKGQPNLPSPDDRGVAQPQMPKYWIGLLGGSITPDNPLRAHLDLPESEGLIVANIVPESPAAKAGLKQHDILLKANDKELHEMQDLVELVINEGPKKGQITLEVLRHNKRETVYLTPEERPANAPIPQVDFNNGAGFGGGQLGGPEAGQIQDLLRQFGGGQFGGGDAGGPMQFRNFGNGVVVGGGEGANMPNGVSITVQHENGKPAHVTVKRGDKIWNVTSDDPESLKQLPDDLRPSVERMLKGNGGAMNLRMPNFEHRMQNPGNPGEVDGRMQDRLERMERRLEELTKKLGEGDHAEKESNK